MGADEFCEDDQEGLCRDRDIKSGPEMFHRFQEIENGREVPEIPPQVTRQGLGGKMIDV